MDHITLDIVYFVLEVAMNEEGDAPLFEEVELEDDHILVTQHDGSRYRLTFERI